MGWRVVRCLVDEGFVLKWSSGSAEFVGFPEEVADKGVHSGTGRGHVEAELFQEIGWDRTRDPGGLEFSGGV